MSGILHGRTRLRGFSITLAVLAAEQAMSYILPSDGAFVAPPTDADIVRLREIRATALAHPLRPEVGRGWSLRLVEELKGGAGKYAQVWRCEVDEPSGADGGKSASVVVKLYRQSLFPFPGSFPSRPETDSWNWYPATHLEMRESRAYSRLSPYQGRDVPICYGFYTFDLPGGERCVGAVLEDLTELSVPLESHLKAMVASKRLQLDALDPLVVGALELQHRLHGRKLAEASNEVVDLVVLASSTRQSPLLVAVGFSRTSTREAVLEGVRIIDAELKEQGSRGMSHASEPWFYGDQARLLSQIRRAAAGGQATMQDWKALEQGRRKLPYLLSEW
ncbi:hypothetical protein JCM10450v2_004842 [Rhodotorula kratochvilovae]